MLKKVHCICDFEMIGAWVACVINCGFRARKFGFLWSIVMSSPSDLESVTSISSTSSSSHERRRKEERKKAREEAAFAKKIFKIRKDL